MYTETIKIISQDDLNHRTFTKQFADCVVLTHDGKVLLQYRPPNWKRLPDLYCNFGGHIEPGETPLQGVVRELHEELGAVVQAEDVLSLAITTEERTGHSEAVHLHFWHDKDATITGCYEAEMRLFDTAADALAEPKLMDYARWILQECVARGLLT